MTKFILSILLIILSLKNCFALCPLEWVYGIYGRHPENAVKSGGPGAHRDEYVARVFYKNKHYVIGRLDMANREVYIEKDDKERKFKAYEVLNNPYNCQLRWVDSCCGQVPPNAVGGTDEYEQNSYVGRTIKRYKGRRLAGKVIPKDGYLRYSYAKKDLKTERYEVLVSEGLTVDLSNFVFDLPIRSAMERHSTLELVGHSILNNPSAASIEQVVEHRKTIQQSFEFSLRKIWSHTFGVRITTKLSIFVASITTEKSYSFTSSEEKVKTFGGSNSSEVMIRTTVKVGPFQSVRVNSAIRMVENYPIKFKATAKYHGDNLEGKQILEMFRKSKSDLKILSVTNDAVYAEVEGTLKGRWGISTEVNSVPIK